MDDGMKSLEDPTRLMELDDEQEKKKISVAPPRLGCRHVLAGMLFLGFLLSFGMRVNLSIALVAMTANIKQNRNITLECPNVDNSSKNIYLPANVVTYDWNYDTQGLILSAFFYGYAASSLPGGIFANYIGGKRLFAFGILFSSLLNLVIPFAAMIGPGAVFAARCISGLCEGVTFPAAHFLLGKWSPTMERSQLGGFSYSGSQLGIVISLAISGLICSSDALGGWPTTFYLLGSIECAFVVLWMILIHDTPSEHPRISTHEKRLIEESMSTHKDRQVPWKKIITCPPVYAVMAAHFASFWGLFTLLTSLPMYMKEVLDFDMTQNGFLSSLPFLASWITFILAGPAADYIRRQQCISITKLRKIFQAIAFVPPAAILVLVQFTNCNKTAIVSLLTLMLGFNGFSFPGYMVNMIDLGPEFAGATMGISSTVATLGGVISPLITGYLTVVEQSRRQWQIVFYITAAFYIFGTIVYVLFASGELQSWNCSEPADSQVLQKNENKKLDVYGEIGGAAFSDEHVQ